MQKNSSEKLVKRKKRSTSLKSKSLNVNVKGKKNTTNRVKLSKEELKKLDDKKLVLLAIDNNQQAFQELMSRHYESTYYIVYKLLQDRSVEAEDLTIEAFAKAFNKLHLYKPEMAKFNTWFVTLVINHTLDYLRKKRLRITSLDKDIDMGDGNSLPNTIRSTDLNPEELFVKAQGHEKVRLAVAKLPALYSEIIQLRYFEDRPYAEIQGLLDLPINTLKTRMHRAKKLLFIILETQMKNR